MAAALVPQVPKAAAAAAMGTRHLEAHMEAMAPPRTPVMALVATVLLAMANLDPSIRAMANLDPSIRAMANLDPSIRAMANLDPSIRAMANLDPSIRAMANLDPSIPAMANPGPSIRAMANPGPSIRAMANPDPNLDPNTLATAHLDPSILAMVLPPKDRVKALVATAKEVPRRPMEPLPINRSHNQVPDTLATATPDRAPSQPTNRFCEIFGWWYDTHRASGVISSESIE